MDATELNQSLTRKTVVTLPSKLGFHLRLAARFVQCVKTFRSNISIRKGRMLADGKSILELLILGAAWKSRLEIVAVGDDAPRAIEVIEEFFLNQDNLTISGSQNNVSIEHDKGCVL